MIPLTVTVAHTVAVVLAVIGATLFGLAAVRQHGAVHDTATPGRGPRHQLHAVRTLIRDRDWLVGSAQALIAGGMHVVALMLASITLVQPIGVLAVPVTVIATSIKQRRSPRRRQVVGALASVGGIAFLTVLLLSPSTVEIVLPPWWLIAATLFVGIGLGASATVITRRTPVLLRCAVQAGSAAVLFGLNSILLRLIGHILRTGAASSEVPLLVTTVLGFAVALPVGLWVMQTAYLSGSPQVVIYCLTLLDPLTAVGGGDLLLQDGVAATGATLLAAGACVLVAVLGVVLLSTDYPVDGTVPVHVESRPRLSTTSQLT